MKELKLKRRAQFLQTKPFRRCSHFCMIHTRVQNLYFSILSKTYFFWTNCNVSYSMLPKIATQPKTATQSMSLMWFLGHKLVFMIFDTCPGMIGVYLNVLWIWILFWWYVYVSMSQSLQFSILIINYKCLIICSSSLPLILHSSIVQKDKHNSRDLVRN